MTWDIPLSASKLKQHKSCPEAFRLGYMEQKPSEGSENRYIRRGDAVHEAIEDVIGDLDRLDDSEYVAHRFRTTYRENGGRHAYDLSEDDHEFVHDCLQTASRFVAKHAPTVVGVESEVRFRDSDLDHSFTGYIDVATETEVWDWKTGTSDGKEEDEVLQGAIYMVGYYHHTGQLPEAVRFVYLKEQEVSSYEPSDAMWGKVLDASRALLQSIENDYYPAKPDDSKCYWCDYEIHCSASPVGAGGIDYESYP